MNSFPTPFFHLADSSPRQKLTVTGSRKREGEGELRFCGFAKVREKAREQTVTKLITTNIIYGQQKPRRILCRTGKNKKMKRVEGKLGAPTD